MTKIYINSENPDYGWDDFMDFMDCPVVDSRGNECTRAESMVILGNNGFRGMEDTDWWNRTKEVADDFYNMDATEFTREYGISGENYKTLDSLADRGKDIRISLLPMLYPRDEFKTRELRGCSQGDWACAVFRNPLELNEDSEMLSDLYFGNVARIFDEDGDYAFIASSELWEAERDGSLASLLRDSLGVPETEKIEVFTAEYVQAVSWKPVDLDEQERE